MSGMRISHGKTRISPQKRKKHHNKTRGHHGSPGSSSSTPLYYPISTWTPPSSGRKRPSTHHAALGSSAARPRCARPNAGSLAAEWFDGEFHPMFRCWFLIEKFPELVCLACSSFLSFPSLALPCLALPFLSFPSPTPGAKKKALGAAPRGTWLFAVFVHAERAQRTNGGETIHGTGRFTQSQTLHVYIRVVWGVNSSAYTP